MQADTFKQLQNELELTNLQMSKLLGVSISTVDKFRSGRRGVNKQSQVILDMFGKLTSDERKTCIKNLFKNS